MEPVVLPDRLLDLVVYRLRLGVGDAGIDGLDDASPEPRLAGGFYELRDSAAARFIVVYQREDKIHHLDVTRNSLFFV